MLLSFLGKSLFCQKSMSEKSTISFGNIRKRMSENAGRKKYVRKSRSEKSTMEFGRNGFNCVFMISVDLGLTSRIVRIQRLTYTSNSYINPCSLPSFLICTACFSYIYHGSLFCCRCVCCRAFCCRCVAGVFVVGRSVAGVFAVGRSVAGVFPTADLFPPSPYALPAFHTFIIVRCCRAFFCGVFSG